MIQLVGSHPGPTIKSHCAAARESARHGYTDAMALRREQERCRRSLWLTTRRRIRLVIGSAPLGHRALGLAVWPARAARPRLIGPCKNEFTCGCEDEAGTPPRTPRRSERTRPA